MTQYRLVPDGRRDEADKVVGPSLHEVEETGRSRALTYARNSGRLQEFYAYFGPQDAVQEPVKQRDTGRGGR